MFYTSVKNGILLGIITGLIITIFECFIIFLLDLYIPFSYPLFQIGFNTVFWSFIGLLSGCLHWLFIKDRDLADNQKNFYWVLFYLLPFALVYGFLGKIKINPSVEPLLSSAYDHHLSILWVGIIFIFTLYFKKNTLKYKQNIVCFIPEISAIIGFFWFCSNNRKFIYQPCFTSISFIQPFFIHNTERNLLILYISLVLIIYSCYVLTFFKFSSFYKRKSLSIALLFILTVGFLASLSFLNYKKLSQDKISQIAPKNYLEPVKIPYVIFIVLDSARSDRFSIYGNNNTLKNIETFSKESVVYNNCIATSGWTLPSHASIFTGLYPSQHGAHKHLDNQENWPTLSDEFVTMAEIFNTNGYATAGVLSNNFILGWTNLGQGFQVYDFSKNIGSFYDSYSFKPLMPFFFNLFNIKPKYGLPYRPAEDINKKIFHLLDRPSPAPFFLFVNYMDTHYPYCPPKPYSRYNSPAVFQLNQYIANIVQRKDQSSWKSNFLLSQYDSEIEYLDVQLEKLFVRLKELKIYDSALIIVTSDHGEMIGEHALFGHRHIPMYDNLLRIPLVIKFPFSRKTGYEEKKTTLADLFSVTLSECGLPLPDYNNSKATDNNKDTPVVSEVYEDQFGEHRVLYRDNYKYMRYGKSRKNELYNLEKDPEEKINLVEQNPEVLSTMKEILSDWEKTHTPVKEKGDAAPAEFIEGLKTLGYIQ